MNMQNEPIVHADVDHRLSQVDGLLHNAPAIIAVDL